MSVPSSKRQEDPRSTSNNQSLQQHSAIMMPDPPPPYHPMGPGIGQPAGSPAPGGVFVGTTRFTSTAHPTIPLGTVHPASYYTTTTVTTTQYTGFRNLHPFQKGLLIFVAVFFLLVIVGTIVGISFAIKSAVHFDEEWKKNGFS